MMQGRHSEHEERKVGSRQDWRRQSSLVALMLSVPVIPVSRAWGSDCASSTQAHVKDLSDRVRTTMPQGNPGSLREEHYLDLIAFMQQTNNFPPGSHELSDTSQLSKTINDDTR